MLLTMPRGAAFNFYQQRDAYIRFGLLGRSSTDLQQRIGFFVPFSDLSNLTKSFGGL